MQFNIIEDATVVLYHNGVFRQAALYERKGFVYAKWSSGFIYLHKGGTSIPRVSWKNSDIGITPKFNKKSRMVLK